MTHRIYLSGPVSGVNPVIAQEWRERFKVAMETSCDAQVECIDPMRFNHTTPLAKGDPGYITTRGRFDVQRADLLVVNFLYGPIDQVVSVGTIIEMAWADAWRKPIIMAAPLDNVTPLFSHPFIKEIVTTVVHTEEELIYQARAFLSLTGPSNEVLLSGPTAEPTPDCPF